mgnify:CR=1 FL=1
MDPIITIIIEGSVFEPLDFIRKPEFDYIAPTEEAGSKKRAERVGVSRSGSLPLQQLNQTTLQQYR